MPLQAEEGLRLAEMQFRRKRRLAVQPIQRILQNGLEHLEIGHGQPQAKAGQPDFHKRRANGGQARVHVDVAAGAGVFVGFQVVRQGMEKGDLIQ